MPTVYLEPLDALLFDAKPHFRYVERGAMASMGMCVLLACFERRPPLVARSIRRLLPLSRFFDSPGQVARHRRPLQDRPPRRRPKNLRLRRLCRLARRLPLQAALPRQHDPRAHVLVQVLALRTRHFAILIRSEPPPRAAEPTRARPEGGPPTWRRTPAQSLYVCARQRQALSSASRRLHRIGAPTSSLLDGSTDRAKSVSRRYSASQSSSS
mmetsp:Transcript_3654/g.11246  ORF Transcript_3654/g.11246 Transcript_3654/m.11246 type:complete len:212 (-) Transcript_3654:859-1494(-)